MDEAFVFLDGRDKPFKAVSCGGGSEVRWIHYWDEAWKCWLPLRPTTTAYIREWRERAMPAEEVARLNRIHEQFRGGERC